MTSRHKDLLTLACRRGIETLGFGHLPLGMSSEDLSGLRLLGRNQLGDAVRIAVAAAMTPEKAPSEQPAKLAAPEGDKTEADRQVSRDSRPTVDLGTYQSQARDGKGKISMDNLLSSEELTALLGDET
jgi:hypothetical protein